MMIAFEGQDGILATSLTSTSIPSRLLQNKLAQASAEEKREAQEDADKPKPTDAARAVSIASEEHTLIFPLPLSFISFAFLTFFLSTPSLIFLQNGNEPSRGAKIDEQIEKEEAEMLRKKGIEP